MSKLYCAYDHSFPKEEIADHKCDICGKLLCKICGYSENGVDFCNECWVDRTETSEEIAERIKSETAREEED